MSVPADLARLLVGAPEVDADEQAFPFLTVDDAGFPHVALLSRAELDVSPDGEEILAAIRSPRTLANLARQGRAGLIAVGGTVAHYAKLTVLRRIAHPDGLVGYALRVSEHKADSLGIPLQPLGFRTSSDIARMERWEASARALHELAGDP